MVPAPLSRLLQLVQQQPPGNLAAKACAETAICAADSGTAAVPFKTAPEEPRALIMFAITCAWFMGWLVAGIVAGILTSSNGIT
eukprot:CAMPEP_0115150536 /NCGR_PEP_ID=MMETSP0227-20121206/65099_1 /TAXON_ID=89957 /ORGANISM="Polarella glacialis, Strain CCMP 1383" /LENGTH=83 /DNA_ID=CAMNT_0002560923 /DNA_START=221 /DNA_END=472 /DNA_ORIENTATION=+